MLTLKNNSNAEATVLQKLNQRTKKGTGCYRSFLDFSLVTFLCIKAKKVTDAEE